MKFGTNLNKESLEGNLKDSKELAVPIAIFLISLCLFLVFILPNILSFPSKKEERDLEVSKLNQIKDARKVLENADANELTSEVDLASNVLPSEKNFELVLSAISEAATNGNVQVAGYAFADSSSKQLTQDNTTPTMDFEISIAGGIDEASKFIDQLYIIYPISEVKSISYDNGISKVDVSFYFKPFISVNAADVALAREKSSDEAKAFSQISQWNKIEINSNSSTSSGQESATQSASPF